MVDRPVKEKPCIHCGEGTEYTCAECNLPICGGRHHPHREACRSKATRRQFSKGLDEFYELMTPELREELTMQSRLNMLRLQSDVTYWLDRDSQMTRRVKASKTAIDLLRDAELLHGMNRALAGLRKAQEDLTEFGPYIEDENEELSGR